MLCTVCLFYCILYCGVVVIFPVVAVCHRYLSMIVLKGMSAFARKIETGIATACCGLGRLRRIWRESSERVSERSEYTEGIDCGGRSFGGVSISDLRHTFPFRLQRFRLI